MISKAVKDLVSYGMKTGLLKEEDAVYARNQILDVTQDDIRALADILDSILKTGAFCVIGNEQQIEADHNMFKEVKELFH